MINRTLGRSGIEISAMGLGCWAIGGPFWKHGQPVGWGQVDDDVSIHCIQHAIDLGVTFFDTADVYGCGHSERVLGQALSGRRQGVIIATKFGHEFAEDTRQSIGYNTNPEYIRQSCEASLQRLNTDVIDLYQNHVKDMSEEHALEVRQVLEELVSAGKIRYYGWSTDSAKNARIFAQGAHCTAIQQIYNVFEGNADTLAVCEEYNLASIIRSPLSMGLLTGKFSLSTQFSTDDLRSHRPALQEKRAQRLTLLESIRSILTQDGRTLAQGALGWLWARSSQTIPIPGFKTLEQIKENIGAAEYGPLAIEQMEQIDQIISETARV